MPAALCFDRWASTVPLATSERCFFNFDLIMNGADMTTRIMASHSDPVIKNGSLARKDNRTTMAKSKSQLPAFMISVIISDFKFLLLLAVTASKKIFFNIACHLTKI